MARDSFLWGAEPSTTATITAKSTSSNDALLDTLKDEDVDVKEEVIDGVTRVTLTVK